MPRPKSPVRESLSPAHLQAIGLVAATWSELEFTLMWLISQESGISFRKTTAMVVGNGVNNWLVILERLVVGSGSQSKWDDFKRAKFIARIGEVQRERNAIVHCAWTPARSGALLDATSPKPAVVAEGIGYKRGAVKFTQLHSYTAAQMRKVAADILRLEAELVAWSATKPPPTNAVLLGNALMKTIGGTA